MKDRWNAMALREKQIVTFGGLGVIILLLYVFIWLPLATSVTELRQQIKHDHELLLWMQNADKQINTLEKNPQATPTHASGSLLSIVQKQINRTALVSALKELHQADNNSVQLSFQQVSFDDLMSWLVEVAQQGLVVTQMSATPSATPGVVNAELVLKGA